ncbi:MAG: HD domain-containing protein [bacterium]|nr:HD domain-containing protein [bacterium]
MLLVPTPALKPGMTLAQPIFHPLSDSCVLLNKGVELKARYIEQLHRFEVGHAWINFPGLEELDGSVNESVSASHGQLYGVIANSIDHLEQRVAVKINLHHYRKAVRCMLADIVDDPDHDVMTHQLAACGSALTGHLANCCYLSLLVGAHMTGYLRHQRSTLPADVAENTSELGVGALLHDIGKLQMPDDLQSKCILDAESEWPEYRYHVRAGYGHAREHVSVVAANIILNHHQRMDGTGFPHRESRDPSREPEPLSGRHIHIFSRIVGLVDAFDHLLCPNGKPVPTVTAIAALRDRRLAGWFDPVAVETLLRLVPPFQVGSVVTLSTGTEAVVVENHPEAPCRPLVRLMAGSLGKDRIAVTARQLDLRMCRDITVAAIDGVDVADKIFTGELEPV